jgi:hypothetical protein
MSRIRHVEQPSVNGHVSEEIYDRFQKALSMLRWQQHGEGETLPIIFLLEQALADICWKVENGVSVVGTAMMRWVGAVQTLPDGSELHAEPLDVYESLQEPPTFYQTPKIRRDVAKLKKFSRVIVRGDWFGTPKSFCGLTGRITSTPAPTKPSKVSVELDVLKGRHQVHLWDLWPYEACLCPRCEVNVHGAPCAACETCEPAGCTAEAAQCPDYDDEEVG